MRTTTDDGVFTGSLADAWAALHVADLRREAAGARVLDVGCHAGNLVAAARDAGFDATGIDLDPVAVAAGQDAGRPVRVAELRELPAASVDAIFMNHVLEHVIDAPALLVDAAAALAPGGLLFVYVPNHRGLVPRLMGTNWLAWLPLEHVWHFDKKHLVDVAESSTSLRARRVTTEGAIEPPSFAGLKGRVKRSIQSLSRRLHWGDEIEAVFVKPAGP